MGIPVGQTLGKGRDQLIGGLKAPSFESQRLQLLPPGLNQIETAGIFGQEEHLYLRPSR